MWEMILKNVKKKTAMKYAKKSKQLYYYGNGEI